MEAKLAHLATLSSKDQSSGYISLLTDLLKKSNDPSVPGNVHLLIDFVTQDHVNIVIARPVLAEIAKNLQDNKTLDSNVKKVIIQDCLEIIQPRLTRFEEQVSSEDFYTRFIHVQSQTHFTGDIT